MFRVIPGRERVFKRLLLATRQIGLSGGLSLLKKGYWVMNNFKCLLGVARGRALFSEAVSKNELALEALYKNYCGTPPVPLKAPANKLEYVTKWGQRLAYWLLLIIERNILRTVLKVSLHWLWNWKIDLWGLSFAPPFETPRWWHHQPYNLNYFYDYCRWLWVR